MAAATTSDEATHAEPVATSDSTTTSPQLGTEGSWIDVTRSTATLEPASSALRSPKRSPRRGLGFAVGRRAAPRQNAYVPLAQRSPISARSPSRGSSDADVQDALVAAAPSEPVASQPAPSPRRRPPDELNGARNFFDGLFRLIRFALLPVSLVLQTLVHIARLSFIPLLQLALCAGLLLAAVGLPAYLLSATFRTTVSPLQMLGREAYAHLQAADPKAAWCSTIGFGCERKIEDDIAVLAHTVAAQAEQAADIFGSVTSLAQRGNFGLDYHKPLAASIAIAAGTTIPEREQFAKRLSEFAYDSRDIGDRVDAINSKAVASFQWTLHGFERVERTIELMHTSRTHRYTSDDVTKSLAQFFGRLNTQLDGMIDDLQVAQKSADRASQNGHLLTSDLSRESTTIADERARLPALRQLFTEQGRFKAHELSRNLAVARRSIEDIVTVTHNLEEARRTLLVYRNNVASFSAGIMGFSMAETNLKPEHEVEALRSIMSRFSHAVNAAKAGDFSTLQQPALPSIDGSARFKEIN